MSTYFNIPLKNGSKHVQIPLGVNLPEDVAPIVQLLQQETSPLQFWVSLGAEYYLANKKNQAEQLFLGAKKQLEQNDEGGEIPGKQALLTALGTYYAIEAQKATQREDHGESSRLRKLADKYLDMEHFDQETELPWLGSGIDLLRRNQVREAKNRFTAALDLTSNESMYALLGMAACSFMEGNYELARNNYASCIRQYSTKCPPTVRVGLGHCFYKLGMHDDAKKAFERARTMDPTNAQAAVGLAILKMNESSDAADVDSVKTSMELLRDAYLEDQSNPMALNHLANHFFWRGDMERVKDFCRKSHETTTHSGMRSEALLLLARAHHKSGDKENLLKAHQYYKDAKIAFIKQYQIDSGKGTNMSKEDKAKIPLPVLLLVGLAQMDLIHGKYSKRCSSSCNYR